MSDRYDSAHPFVVEATDHQIIQPGLTKYEYAVIKYVAAFIASDKDGQRTLDDLIDESIEIANATFDALDGEK